MEARHAENALAKARRAVETIETDVVWVLKDDPDFPEVTDQRSGLEYVHYVLFGTARHHNPQLTAALWNIIGGFYSINAGTEHKGTVTRFDTSRPFIEAELLNRIAETRPQAPTDDPFSVFASNASGQN